MMEDSPNGYAKAGVAGIAMMALFAGIGRNSSRLAVWASDDITPADFLEMSDAIGVEGELTIYGTKVHCPLP